MQQYNHPDQDKAREIVVERLKKAATGRHVPITERPACSFVKVSESLPSFISIITGPSRTADIEKTLILGGTWNKGASCTDNQTEILPEIMKTWKKVGKKCSLQIRSIRLS